MKVFFLVAALLLGLMGYRAVVPAPAANPAPARARPLPDSDSLVAGVCESKLLGNAGSFAEVVTSAVSLSATGDFKGYAAQLELTGADGGSHYEDWVCRYYRDGHTELEKL